VFQFTDEFFDGHINSIRRHRGTKATPYFIGATDRKEKAGRTRPEVDETAVEFDSVHPRGIHPATQGASRNESQHECNRPPWSGRDRHNFSRRQDAQDN